MKKLTTIMLAILLLISPSVSFAQTDTDKEVKAAKEYFEFGRKKIVELNVKFTEEEGKKFWPVYESYRKQTDKLVDRLGNLIASYSSNYKMMDDKLAAELMVEYLDIEDEKVAYKNIYIKKLINFLPNTKVLKLLQVENKIEAAIRYEISMEVPFVKLPE